jgi:hypothetical protein
MTRLVVPGISIRCVFSLLGRSVLVVFCDSGVLHVCVCGRCIPNSLLSLYNMCEARS